jgi:segregation and condensation protein B
MPLCPAELKHVIEVGLLTAGRPLSMERLLELFEEEERPACDAVLGALDELRSDYEARGIELREVASGYRVQVRPGYVWRVSRVWEEKPGRYSRALLETLALIAYRQPITRGEIEDVRGVSVSTSIIKTLLDRRWVRVVGHRNVPGRPAMYATTREFLDYFNLKGLGELPTLSEIRDIDPAEVELRLVASGVPESPEDGGTDDAPGEDDARVSHTAGK